MTVSAPDDARSRRDGALPIAARRHPLVGKVQRRLFGRCGLERGASMVIGCSGGADSTALVLCAAVIARRRGRGGTGPMLRPRVVHVHHHLRASADADAAFVRSLCEGLGLPCEVRDVHPAEVAGNRAAAARALRYDALRDAAAQAGCAAIAVAHHADDQLETMLMAIGRGTGLAGIGGMAWTTPLAGNETAPVTLVRPMLDVRRAECEELCTAAGIEWRDDPSNDDRTGARVRLRREVLPVMESLWPGAARRAASTAEIVGTAAAALEHVLATTFGEPSRRSWWRAELAALPPALIAAGLRRAALDAAPDHRSGPGQRRLDAAAEAITDDVRRPRRFEWPGGLELVVRAREVELSVAVA